MQKFIITCIEKAYHRVFGHPMSQRAHNFLNHLSWSLVGILFSSGIIFGMNVFVGRVFGPEEYGKYNLVLTFAYILSALMVFGQDVVAIRSLVRCSSEISKQNISITNSLFVVVFASMIVGALAWFLTDPLVSLLETEKTLWLIAIVYSMVFSVKVLVDSFFRGLGLFKEQAITRIVEVAVIVCIFFVEFFFWKHVGYLLYIKALFLGCVCFVAVFVFFKGLELKSFRWEKCKKNLPYIMGVIWMSLLSILSVSVDKLFVGRYVGLDMLGLYSAYIMASILLVMQVTNILSNVFFPFVSSVGDLRIIIRKTDVFSVVSFFPGVGVLLAVSGGIFSLFGTQYIFSWTYLFLFALSGMFQFLGSLYRSVAMAKKEFFRKMQYLTSASMLFFVGILLLSVKIEGDIFFHIVFSYFVYSALSFFAVRSSCSIQSDKDAQSLL